MSPALHPEIVITETADSVHYRLPARDMRELRVVGHVLLFVAIAVWSVPFISGWWMAGAGGLAWLPTLASLVPTILFSGALIAIRSIFLGHSEVAIENGNLIAIDKGSLFRITRKRPVDQVRGLIVRIPKGEKQPQSSMFANTNTEKVTLTCIEVNLASGQPIWLAMGYSTDLLLSFANDLHRRLKLAAPVEQSTIPIAPPRVVEGNAPVFQERLEQPAKSTAILDRQDNGLTITIPPAGLRRGGGFLFFFGLAWCGFMAFLTLIFIGMLLTGKAQGDGDASYFIAPLFWLVGGLMLFAGIRRARSYAVLAVVGDSLMVMYQGVFGKKQGEWTRDQLANICPGPSGVEVNDEPVMELHIEPKEGKRFGLLYGRDLAELEWIATVLRQALRVPADFIPAVSAAESPDDAADN